MKRADHRKTSATSASTTSGLGGLAANSTDLLSDAAEQLADVHGLALEERPLVFLALFGLRRDAGGQRLQVGHVATMTGTGDTQRT